VPKLIDDPSWEVMAVPETLGLDDFLAASRREAERHERSAKGDEP